MLSEQIKEFKPQKVAVANRNAAIKLAERISHFPQVKPEILYGDEGNIDLAKVHAIKSLLRLSVLLH